jgi:hypothetical protein
VAQDAFHPFTGVDVLLDGYLVGASLLEEAAGADVNALGILTKDHQANIVRDTGFERGKPLMEELRRPGVDVKVELEAQTKKDVRGVLVGRDAGIAESAKEDGVELVAKHLNGAFRQGDFFEEIFVSSPVELDEFERSAAFGDGGLDHLDSDWGNFPADAVTGDDSNTRMRTAFAKRYIGHGSGSGGSIGLR